MEEKKQIVKICVDKSRSHSFGLLPYVRYNSDDNSTQFVTVGDKTGNWGEFSCDLAKVETNVKQGEGVLFGLSYTSGPHTLWDKGDESRLSFCDIMLRYNRIQKTLRNAILTKAVIKNVDDPDSKIIGKQISKRYGVCTEGNYEADECCEYQISEREKIEEIQLSTKFTELKTKYEFTPMPLGDFTSVSKELYKPNNGITVREGEFISLLDDYEAIIAANEWWNDWWGKWFGSRTAWMDRYPIESGEFWFCRLVEKYFLGKVLVPEKFNGEDITGIRVPDYVYYTELSNDIEWFEKRFGSNKEKIKKAVAERGGRPFYNFLKSLENTATWITTDNLPRNGQSFAYVPPVITFQTVLEDEHEYSGLYESYMPLAREYNEEEFCEEFGVSSVAKWVDNPGIFTESKLVNVMDEDATEVEGITGTWGTFNGGYGLFKCMFHIGGLSNTNNFIVETQNGWWECEKIEQSNIRCADGETIRAGELKYRTVTILECIKNAVPNPANRSVYYFLAKKNNGLKGYPNSEIIPFEIPYSYDRKVHNLRSIDGRPNIYIGDCVDSIVTNSTSYTITYTIGATFRGDNANTKVDNTGITYRETCPYKEKQTIVTYMDGFDNVNVYYNAIDMEGSKESVYAEEYGLQRMANRAEIIGMEVGSMFNEGSMIVAPVFTKEGSNSFTDDPKKILDVVFNRGAAAAFESHFKLSECNTFEDLKNYGNNHFNL